MGKSFISATAFIIYNGVLNINSKWFIRHNSCILSSVLVTDIYNIDVNICLPKLESRSSDPAAFFKKIHDVFSVCFV